MDYHNFDEARVTMTPLEYGKCPSRCNNSFVIDTTPCRSFSFLSFFLFFFRLFFFFSFYTNIAVNAMWTKFGGTARLTIPVGDDTRIMMTALMPVMSDN